MSSASPAIQAAHEAQRKNRRERQARFISLLSEGLNIQQCCDSLGLTRQTYYLWCKKHADFRERAQAAIRSVPENKEKLSSFAEFRLRYFNMRTFWHQRKMVEAIESSPDGGITLILVPPEWGKTTLIEDYFCYLIANDPNMRIVHMSQSQGHSRKIIGRLQRRMLDERSAYYQRFGPFKAEGREATKPWNADFFTIAKATHDERDYTMESRGGTSQIQGARAELIVLDDIQSDKTLSQTKKIFDHIRQEVVTRPGQHGHIIVVGTRIGFGDIYEAMIEADGFIDRLVQIPALDEEGHSNFPPQFDETGAPLTDARGHQLGWSEDALAQRKSKTEAEIWDRTYMQAPSSKMGQPFSEEAIRNALDRDRKIGDRNPAPGTLGGMDPALGGHAAFIVAGFSSEKLHVLDLEDHPGLGRTEQLFAIISNLTSKYHPGGWVIETESMQKGLARDERLYKMGEQMGFYVHEHTTRGVKFDPSIGVASMAGAFRRGEIRLPYGDEYSRAQTDLLLTQLRKWRPDIPARLLRQDLVMALWFVYLRWQAEKLSLQTSTSSWKRAGVPYGSPFGIPRAA